MVTLNFFILQRRKTNPQNETGVNVVSGYTHKHTQTHAHTTDRLQQNDSTQLNLETTYPQRLLKD